MTSQPWHIRLFTSVRQWWNKGKVFGRHTLVIAINVYRSILSDHVECDVMSTPWAKVSRQGTGFCNYMLQLTSFVILWIKQKSFIRFSALMLRTKIWICPFFLCTYADSCVCTYVFALCPAKTSVKSLLVKTYCLVPLPCHKHCFNSFQFF